VSKWTDAAKQTSNDTYAGIRLLVESKKTVSDTAGILAPATAGILSMLEYLSHQLDELTQETRRARKEYAWLHGFKVCPKCDRIKTRESFDRPKGPCPKCKECS
jgi:hypothetical protein